MTSYVTPIPGEVLTKLDAVLRNHAGYAFDVRVSAFPGDDGEQMFSVDVFTDAKTIVPSDRRQKSLVQATETTYFFNADGEFVGKPQVYHTRYR